MIKTFTNKDDKRIPEDVMIVYSDACFRWLVYWKQKWHSGVAQISPDLAEKVEKDDGAVIRQMLGAVLVNMKMTMKDEGLTNQVKGGVGYYEYLRHKIKNAKNIFKNSQFIYLEYDKKDKKQNEFFKKNGFEEPYPRASLGIRIAFRENDELVVKDNENKDTEEN